MRDFVFRVLMAIVFFFNFQEFQSLFLIFEADFKTLRLLHLKVFAFRFSAICNNPAIF